MGLICLVVVAGINYQRATDTTYAGMTIIPEHHNDIPLYKGLTPTEYDYVMKGDHWEDIYIFYMEELPKHGWSVSFQQTSRADAPAPGFYSLWQKAGVDYELLVKASYFPSRKQTEVRFDKH